MIRINELYNQFNSAYNTNQFGFFRPVTDFVPAVQEVNMWMFDKLVGIAPTNQKVQDWLMPFRKTRNIAVEKKPQHDYAPKPDDYEFFAASRIIMEGRRIVCETGCDMVKDGVEECVPFADIADDFKPKNTSTRLQYEVPLVVGNKWASVTSHATKGPSLEAIKPRVYIRQIEDGFEVQPEDVGVIVMEYYRKPNAPKFNYNTKEDGPDVYLEFHETGSVHLEWSETLLSVFLYRLGKRYGLGIHDQLILSVRNIDKIFE